MNLYSKILSVDPAGKGGFQTIQAALDAAEAGDEVEIRGGVYYERLVMTRSGTEEAPIILRPYANHQVIIRAGRRLEGEWREVPGRPDLFECRGVLLGEEEGVWEMPARARLMRLSSRERVDGRLGSWFYDEAAKALYVRGIGDAPLEEVAFWVESPEPALYLKNSHVRVERLSFALGEHGILLDRKSEGHVIRGCRADANAKAGIHVSGGGHRAEGNIASYSNAYGIQLRYRTPRFADPQNLDFTLLPDSDGVGMAHDGGNVGWSQP